MSKITTSTRWRLPQWLRWPQKQEGDYNSVLDGYIDRMDTATVSVSKMTTWTRRRLHQCLRWLHGQEGDYTSGLDGDID